MPALNTCSDTYNYNNSAVSRLTQPPPCVLEETSEATWSSVAGRIVTKIFPIRVIPTLSYPTGKQPQKITTPENGCLKECTFTT